MPTKKLSPESAAILRALYGQADRDLCRTAEHIARLAGLNLATARLHIGSLLVNHLLFRCIPDRDDPTLRRYRLTRDSAHLAKYGIGASLPYFESPGGPAR